MGFVYGFFIGFSMNILIEISIQYKKLLYMSFQPLFLSTKMLPASSSSRRATGLITSLTIATAVTGFNWWIQSRIANAENARQEQIIERVRSDKTVQLHQLRNIEKLHEYEGCKINVQGEFEVGRFVVKRNKAGEEGYVVLAPFVVSKEIVQTDHTGKKINEKYMLNLGWVPKETKYRIMETTSTDPVRLNDVLEEYSTDENPPKLATVTAYIRKGEQRDILRGYNNWTKSELYKFIDLQLMSHIFCCVYPSFRYVYLDRSSAGNTGNFPEASTKSDYLNELNEQIKFNNNRRRNVSLGVGIASFGGAILAALL